MDPASLLFSERASGGNEQQVLLRMVAHLHLLVENCHGADLTGE